MHVRVYVCIRICESVCIINSGICILVFKITYLLIWVINAYLLKRCVNSSVTTISVDTDLVMGPFRQKPVGHALSADSRHDVNVVPFHPTQVQLATSRNKQAARQHQQCSVLLKSPFHHVFYCNEMLRPCCYAETRMCGRTIVFPVTYTSQTAIDNHKLGSSMGCGASPKHQTSASKRLALNNASVNETFP